MPAPIFPPPTIRKSLVNRPPTDRGVRFRMPATGPRGALRKARTHSLQNMRTA
ncbi:hypothetical protein FA95DRAFT_1557199 [Auriscalpium vulgare]|uniref:Uncharacterized protein n=1 Tax=Auriscalpium vulgare TaxID=40419 RepID=A0ACB8RZ29_9AGAM|nr:hypothetical protein FA95DRAFT_1557199 [Auriscalpium vulgare]